MRRLLTIAFLTLVALSPAFALEPLGFSEWKSQQVSKSQALIDEARIVAFKRPVSSTIERAKALQLQLDQAKELTISDYFAGYVLNFSEDKPNMVKLVKKLSADENAQLLLLFAKNLSQQRESKIQRSADHLFFE